MFLILRSSNQTEFHQLLKKSTYGNSDLQDNLKHDVAALYVRMRRSTKMTKTETKRPITSIVKFFIFHISVL